MNKSSKRDLEPLLLIALTLGATALLEPPRGAAQCTTTQSVPSIVIEKRVTTRDAISLPSVTMSNCAQFVIGFQDRSETNDEQHDVFFLRYDADTTTMAYSGDENGTVLSTQSAECTPVLPRSTKNEVISIAIGAATQPGGSPPLYATWTGKLNGLHGAYGEHSYRLRHPAANGQDPTTWTFDQTKPTPIRYSLCDENGDQAFNSAGMSSSETLIRTSAWTAIGAFLRTPPGLVAETPAFHRLRSVEMFNHRYNPCIATSQTGESVLVFAVPEDPSSVFSVLDIFIAQFDASGGVVPDPGTDAVGVQVNLPDPPDSFRSQESPAVSLVDDRIVVVFVGPDKTCPSKRRIYARRFEWGGSQVPATQPIPLDVEEFPVNDDLFADLVIGNPPLNNPTVSITTSTQPGNYGKFFVAWHTKPNATSSDIEIRGRYFNGDGTPETGEFRVN